MVWLGLTLKFPNLSENSKQRIHFNTGCATNVPFWEYGSNFRIFKQASENSSEHVSFKRCCNEKFLKIVKN